MNNLNVCTIENKGEYFFFDGDRLFFNPSNKIINSILELLNNDKKKEEIIEILKRSYSVEMLEEAFNAIKDYFDNDESKMIVDYEANEQKWREKKSIQHLWLNISNDCNLRCIYCYGSGGNYGKDRSLMKEETAKKCIDYWYENLDDNAEDIYVCFFGGEPFMNKKVFTYCINYINELLKDRTVNKNFLVTTNGTILDDDYKKLIQENNIQITISMDGGEDITKVNRPNVNGESSYYCIKKNLPEFRNYAGDITARVTLTQDNVDKLSDIVEELCEMGFSSVHYEMVSINDEKIGIFQNNLENLFLQIDKLSEETYKCLSGRGKYRLENLVTFINNIHNRARGGHCSFYADNILMYGSEGQLFKCHRLSVEDEYIYGSVDKGLDVKKYLNIEAKKKLTKCNHCIAKNLCSGGCAHVNLTYNNDLTESYEVYCENIRYLLKAALKIYSDIVIEKCKNE